MLRALAEYRIHGIKTIIPFFKRILLHPKFNQGNYTTHFLEELEKEEELMNVDEQAAALIAAGIKSYKESRQAFSIRTPRMKSNWKVQGRMKSLSDRL